VGTLGQIDQIGQFFILLEILNFPEQKNFSGNLGQ
jgi:hypothetical protein